MISVDVWAGYGWLVHGFSRRAGGVSTVYSDGGPGELNLGYTKEDSASNVMANRGLFLLAVAGDEEMGLLTVRQVHGTEIRVVRAGEDGLVMDDGRLVEADGLVTDVPGVMLGVFAADCVPVLVADVRRRVVGAFHAGWRGTAAGIVGKGIARMTEAFGSMPDDLVGAVGPSIGRCCYVVGEEVKARFAEGFGYGESLVEAREDGWHVDLAEANRRQLMDAGMAEANIWVSGECTACSMEGGRRKYFSHRAEKGFTGRGMGVIGIALMD